MNIFSGLMMLLVVVSFFRMAAGAEAGAWVMNHDASMVATTGAWWVVGGGTTRLQGEGGAMNRFDNLALFGPLRVAPGVSLDVMGSLQNDLGAEGLVLMADAQGMASLIHHQGGVEATLQRYLPAVGDWQGQAVDWHTLSTPVMEQSLEAFVPTSGDYDLYGWSEAWHSWINFKQTADFLDFNQGMDFLPGWGYLAAYELEQNFAFKGIMHASEVNGGSLARSGPQGGWHLLGNPFASALDWNCTSWTRQGLNGEVHYWDRTRGNYVSNNDGLGDFSGLIPSQQAVFVRVAAMDKTVVKAERGWDGSMDRDDGRWYGSEDTEGQGVTLPIPPGARRHGQGPEKHLVQWSEQQKMQEWPEKTLRLEVRPLEGAGWTDAVFLRLKDGAMKGFDAARDAHKLPGMGGAPMLYARKGELDLSIGVFPPEVAREGLGLWFAPGSGNPTLFVLSVQGAWGFEPDRRLVLLDRHTHQRMDLHRETQWVFGPSTLKEEPRFVLLYGERGDACLAGGQEDGTLVLYAHADALYVGLPAGVSGGQLQVFGLDGRLRGQWALEGEGLHRVEAGLTPGVYVARLLVPGRGHVGRRLWIGATE